MSEPKIDKPICFWCGETRSSKIVYNPKINDLKCLSCGNRFRVPDGVRVGQFQTEERR